MDGYRPADRAVQRRRRAVVGEGELPRVAGARAAEIATLKWLNVPEIGMNTCTADS